MLGTSQPCASSVGTGINSPSPPSSTIRGSLAPCSALSEGRGLQPGELTAAATWSICDSFFPDTHSLLNLRRKSCYFTASHSSPRIALCQLGRDPLPQLMERGLETPHKVILRPKRCLEGPAPQTCSLGTLQCLVPDSWTDLERIISLSLASVSSSLKGGSIGSHCNLYRLTWHRSTLQVKDGRLSPHEIQTS